jgi:hypothetical protein
MPKQAGVLRFPNNIEVLYDELGEPDYTHVGDEYYNWYIAYGYEQYRTSIGIDLVTQTNSLSHLWRGVDNYVQSSNILGSLTYIPEYDYYGVHRSYPTMELFTVTSGATRPVISPLTTGASIIHTSFDVWLDMTVDDSIGQWFSFLTITPDTSSQYFDVLTLNCNGDGVLDIAGKSNVDLPLTNGVASTGTVVSTSAVGETPFTYRQWNRFDVYHDYNVYQDRMRATIVWVNGRLIQWEGYGTVFLSPCTLSSSDILNTIYVSGTSGVDSMYKWYGSAKFHYGLYCRGDITSGRCYNDNVFIGVIG